MESRSLARKDFSPAFRNVLIGLTLLSFLLCYSGVFLSLGKQWRSNEIYSHGFLIPFISMYLFSFKREEIAAVPLEPNYVAGIPAVSASLLCLILGRIAGILVLEEISIVLSIASFLLLLFGRSLLRSVWFPVFYLLFMIPFWDIFTNDIQFPFQLLSALIGVKILNWIGIPIYHNGIFIELPNITLEVAKSCSGLNYLISILAIGIPLSYVYMKRLWKRVCILLTAVLIALLSNGIRVSLVGFFAYKGTYMDNNNIHGPFQLFQALTVSFVGYLVIFLLVWFLKDDIPRFPRTGKIVESVRRRLFKNTQAVPLAVCVTILTAYGGFLTFLSPTSSPPKKVFDSFPYVVGQWEGHDATPELPFNKQNSASQELSRRYYSGFSPPVKLYIGYYELQNQGNELIDYQNDYLFNDSNSIELITESGDKIRINKYVTSSKNHKMVHLYWVQVNGHIILDKYAEKYHTVMNALLNQKTNGAIVVMSTDVPCENGIEAALETELEFMRRIYPILKEYLP